MAKENIISAVIHVDETTPHLHCGFCAVDQGGTTAKDVIGDKENAQDAREILEAKARKVPALNLPLGAGESTI